MNDGRVVEEKIGRTVLLQNLVGPRLHTVSVGDIHSRKGVRGSELLL